MRITTSAPERDILYVELAAVTVTVATTVGKQTFPVALGKQNDAVGQVIVQAGGDMKHVGQHSPGT